MKKYYCPECKEFKSRFELEAALVGHETYGDFCKWCHCKVVSTETVIKKIIAKNLTDKDFDLTHCIKGR